MHDNPPVSRYTTKLYMYSYYLYTSLLQDFIRLKAGRENSKMILPSRPPPSWSELSTIEIERHFQSSPTISDS